ncbi:MAG: hypothetical protein AB7K52_11650 [Phycisphaerales bacterium]
MLSVPGGCSMIDASIS